LPTYCKTGRERDQSKEVKRKDAENRGKSKVKVKFSLYRPGVALRVGRGIALLFHDHDTRRG